MPSVVREWNLGYLPCLLLLALLLGGVGLRAEANIQWGPAGVIQESSDDTGISSRHPDFATDGQGNWVVVWSGFDMASPSSDSYIFVRHSSDDGISWSEPSLLAANIGENLDPRVETSGNGVWICVWESNDTLNGFVGSDFNIQVARSVDNGANWSGPALLNSNATATVGLDRKPRLATDKAGNWIIVWHSQDSLDGTIGEDWDSLLSRSADDGLSWTPPTPLNNDAYTNTQSDAYPDIATDGNGVWIAVWHTADVAGYEPRAAWDVRYARSLDNGATWSDPRSFFPEPFVDIRVNNSPRILYGGDGRWFITWHSNNPKSGEPSGRYRILSVRSEDNGLSWTMPNPVGTGPSSASQLNPAPTFTDTGALLVAWHSFRLDVEEEFEAFRSIAHTNSTDFGATWGQSIFIDALPVDDFGGNMYPVVAGASNGAALLAWRTTPFGGQQSIDDFGLLRFMRSEDGGNNWATEETVNGRPLPRWLRAFDTKVAFDAQGRGIVVWSEKNFVDPRFSIGSNIFYAISEDKGQTWSDRRSLHHVSTFSGKFNQKPSVAADGDGRWMVIWQSEIDTGKPQIVYVLSEDNGEHWSVPSLIAPQDGFTSAQQREPLIAADKHGRWYAAWKTSEGPPYFGGIKGSVFNVATGLWSPAHAIAPFPYHNLSNFDIESACSPDGVWTVMWTPLDLLNHGAVSLVRSIDQGQNWSTPKSLHTVGYSFAFSAGSPSIATDGKGNWLATWRSVFSLSPVILNTVGLARSVDDGETWEMLPSVAEFEYQPSQKANEVAVATDTYGNWMLTWLERHEYLLRARQHWRRSTNLGSNWTGQFSSNFFDIDFRPAANYALLAYADIESWFTGSGRRGPLGGGYRPIESQYQTGTLLLPRPEVVLTGDSDEEAVTAGFHVTATFSEAVSGFSDASIAVTNGTVSALEGAGAEYRFFITPLEDGAVTVTILDKAAVGANDLPSRASEPLTRVFDSLYFPRVTAILPVFQGPLNFEDVPFTVHFDREMEGFDAEADLVLNHTGTSHSHVVITQGPRIFIVVVYGLRGDGHMTLSVNTEGNVQSKDGIPLASSVASVPVYIDTVPPAVELSAGGAYFNSAVTLHAKLSEEIDWAISPFNLRMENVQFMQSWGAGQDYWIMVKPDQEGPFAVSVRDRAFMDKAENHNLASNTFTGIYDTTAPVITHAAATPNTVLAGEAVRLSFEISEELAAPPTVITNGVPAAFAGGKSSGIQHYTVLTDPLAPLGPVDVQVLAVDYAGNVGVFEAPGLFMLVEPGTALPLRGAQILVVVLLGLGVAGIWLGRRRKAQ